MTSTDKNSKHADADILQCKADIRRALSIMPEITPAHKNNLAQKPISQKREKATDSANATPVSSEEEKTAREDTSPIPIETIPPKKNIKTPQELTEIPTFNLAEEIMAEQRKITAIRRKAPGKKNEAQTEQLQDKTQSLSEQEQIIADIVARDIERLCRGDTLDTQ